jgi:citrate synthase
MMIASIASLSTFTPEANPAIQGDAMYMHPKGSTDDTVDKVRERFVFRALGKIPTIASAAYRHRSGRNSNSPMYRSLNYCENLLYMMDKLNEPDYIPDPRLVKILDKLFILMAEHGVSCSTVMMRHLASSGVDPYTALSGTAGAMFGERKSANVITMLKEINSIEEIDSYLDLVKNSSRQSLIAKGNNPKSIKPKLLMGFGHRIYKQVDPRARLCKKLVMELFDLLGLTENGKIAIELEKKVSKDEWFLSRKLFPNVDFWLALAFDTFDFPSDMFPVWMFIPRFGFLI